MENRFEILMKQINMPHEVANSAVFREASIRAVEVHERRRLWHFILHFKDFPSADHLELMSKLTHAAFSEIAETRLTLEVDAEEPSSDQLNSYYQLALRELNIPAFLSVFKRFTPVKFGKIIKVFIADLPNVKQLAQRDFPRLQEKLWDFGLSNFEFSYEIDLEITDQSLSAHEFEVREMLSAASNTQQEIEALKQNLEIRSSKVGKEKSKAERAAVRTGINLGRAGKKEKLITPMLEVQNPEENVVFEGFVFKAENKSFTNRTTQKTSHMLEIGLTDYSSSFIAQKWARGEEAAVFDELVAKSKNGLWIRVGGSIQMDNFKHELVLQIKFVEEIKAKNQRSDQMAVDQKRVEFHAHTNMSTMDALPTAEQLVKQAAKWGHSALAITDHAGVQSFPDAYQAGKKHGVKIIYGLEANLVEDQVPIVLNPRDEELFESTYVVFDVETTGLSANYNKLIQVAASKMYKGNVIEEFDEFLDPGQPLSQFTTDLTGITDDHVRGSKPLSEVLKSFQKFCEGSILVAHNASFDVGFMNANYEREGLSTIGAPVIDTLELARNLHPELKRHGLGPLTKKFQVGLDNHHRANYDAEATGRLLFIFFEELKEKGITNLNELNTQLILPDSYKKARPKHATIYAQTQEGLKNIFKLVSYSNVKYFAGVPRIPKSVLGSHRAGLVVGSACLNGEVWEAITTQSEQRAEEVAAYYDFLEVMPQNVYRPLLATGGFSNEQELQEALKKLVILGEKLDKPVLATGNVHYINPEDAIYREIIVRGLGEGAEVNRKLGHGERALPAPLPEVPFLTTEEMLEAFKFLGEVKAKEIVIDNTRKLSEEFDSLSPVREDLYTPYREGAEEDIARLTYESAHQIYGNPLPDVVDARLEKELRSIIGNGFAVIYLIAQELVARSNARGYLVGSRGSVGSSLVATMIGITEVNPLPPHYICRNCQHFEIFTDGTYGSGFDMPDKACPDCGEKLQKNGQDIPFETFLGFKGDKVPDIDLNFSGDDQPYAHLDVRDIFGEEYAFRAGTIGTVADKTAYGFVKGYERDYGKMYRNAEIDRLASGSTGVKRSTGQHPGGIIVIPNYMDVYDFSPVQFPADDTSSAWQTTHFDFHAIHDNILKLDILGHDDPTMIRKLQNLSGIDPIDIPMDDKEVLKLFTGTESLGITKEQAMTGLGTYGIPEMGTYTSMNMISEAKPRTFADLLQISGLSHGTDVWKGNAQDLIRQGVADLSSVIGCRDDIMVYLIHSGLEQSSAFKIMEVVRKGLWNKISEDEREGYISAMKKNGVPNWYIESCAKIKYMFPKAHATAYIMMALRVAWFKVHRPMDYYCAWFSIRAGAYELETMSATLFGIKDRIKDIERRSNDRENPATKKELDLLVTLQLCNEMRERGFEFGKIDLYKSDAEEFIIEGDKLIPPFKVMDSLGINVAKSIVEARKDGEFLSKNELKQRTGLSQTLIEAFDAMGVLGKMPEDNQLSLFDM